MLHNGRPSDFAVKTVRRFFGFLPGLMKVWFHTMRLPCSRWLWRSFCGFFNLWLWMRTNASRLLMYRNSDFRWIWSKKILDEVTWLMAVVDFRSGGFVSFCHQLIWGFRWLLWRKCFIDDVVDQSSKRWDGLYIYDFATILVAASVP